MVAAGRVCAGQKGDLTSALCHVHSTGFTATPAIPSFRPDRKMAKVKTPLRACTVLLKS